MNGDEPAVFGPARLPRRRALLRGPAGQAPKRRRPSLPAETAFHTTFVGDVPVVSGPVEIDLSGTDRLRAALLAAADDHSVVVADLSATGFCDTQAIRALIVLSHQLARRGGQLRLVIGAGPVAHILEMLGADQILAVFPSLIEAASQQS